MPTWRIVIWPFVDVTLQRYPLAFFELIVLLRHGQILSVNGFIFFCTAAGCDRMWRQYLRMYVERLYLNNIIKFLNEYPDCNLELLPKLPVMVGEGIAQRVTKIWQGYTHRHSEIRILIDQRLFGDVPQERILDNIFIFKMVRARPGADKPGSYVTLPRLNGGIIFLPDYPTVFRGSARYYFLHELGHLSALGNYFGRMGTEGVRSFAYVSYLLVAQTNHGSEAKYFLFYRTASKFHEEVCADCFGLDSIDASEIQQISKYLKSSKMTDQNLPDEINMKRKEMFNQNLERRLVGLTCEYPNWIPLPIPTMIGLILLGCYAIFFIRPLAENDDYNFGLAVALTMVSMIFSIIRMIRRKNKMRKIVESRLSIVWK
jgi:hypothetical protein